MAQSQLELCNSALSKLGCRVKLTTVSTTGTTQEERACASRVDICKRTMLAMHPWNFAIKRTNLEPSYVAITGAVSSGGKIQVLTASTSGLSNGDRVTINSITGTTEANGTWVISGLVLNTSFILEDSTFNNAYVSGGQWTKAGGFDYTYSIALPSDYLRVLRVNDQQVSPEWRIEGGRILTNDDTNYVKYIYDIGTSDSAYALMNIMFYEALALYLAFDISLELGRDNQTKEQLGRDFKEVLHKARFVDATEDPAEQIEASDWLSSRIMYRGSNSDPRYW
jgi:hypothetical protein